MEKRERERKREREIGREKGELSRIALVVEDCHADSVIIGAKTEVSRTESL